MITQYSCVTETKSGVAIMLETNEGSDMMTMTAVTACCGVKIEPRPDRKSYRCATCGDAYHNETVAAAIDDWAIDWNYYPASHGNWVLIDWIVGWTGIPEKNIEVNVVWK